jgi:hypothetical protein
VHGNWNGCRCGIFGRIPIVLHNGVNVNVVVTLLSSHPFLALSLLSLFFLLYLLLSLFRSPQTFRYNPAAGAMASYNAIDSRSPYGSGDPYYNASTGYITPSSAKKPLSPWIKFGIPVAVLVVAGAVAAGVLASRHHSNNSSSSSNLSPGSPAAASSAVSAKNAVGIFPTATDSEFMVPVYPSTVGLAKYVFYF